MENPTHYVWGQGCDGWHLVRAEQLSVIEERMPPGTFEVSHHHRLSRQFFYVLDGTLTMVINEQATTLTEGLGIEIAPGTVHQVRNDSNLDVRFLVISQPPSHHDRVESKSH